MRPSTLLATVALATPIAAGVMPPGAQQATSTQGGRLTVRAIALEVERPGKNPDYPDWGTTITVTAPQKLSLRWRSVLGVVAAAEWQVATSPFPANGAVTAPAGLIRKGTAGASHAPNLNHKFLLDLAEVWPARASSATGVLYLRLVGLNADGAAVGRASNTVTITLTKPGDWGMSFAFPSVEALQGTIFSGIELKHTPTLPKAMIDRPFTLIGDDLIEHQGALTIEFLKGNTVVASAPPLGAVTTAGGKDRVQVTTPAALDIGPHLVRVRITDSATSNTRPIYVDHARIDASIAGIVASRKVPAAGGAIVTRNGLKAIGVAGNRRHGTKMAVTISDRWHLGSDTKAMTAMLTAILADRKVIGWTETIPQVFPELAKTMKAPFKQVTVEMLLAHRGGLLSSETPYTGLPSLTDNMTVDLLRYRFVKAVLERPPAQAVGSFTYSNVGYIIVGAMLERRTGKTWEQLMAQEIFKPLGITNAGFGPLGSGGVPYDPAGHYEDATGRHAVLTDNPAAHGPAGTVHMDLEGWARFLRVYLNGSEANLTLSRLAMARLTTPYAGRGESYGAGWFINREEGRLSHAGTNGSWYALATVYLNQGYATLAATNLGNSFGETTLSRGACADIRKMLIERYGK